jgi:hypothetical protein
MPRPTVNSTKVSIVLHPNQWALIEGIRKGGLLGETSADVVRQLVSRALERELASPLHVNLLEYAKNAARAIPLTERPVDEPATDTEE